MKNRSILWRIAARSLVVNGIFLSIFFYSVSTFIENYLSLKFDENLNEIPPGIYRPDIVEIFQYWGWED